MCDDDWEDDFKKHEHGPQQRNIAKEQREAKTLFENGKLNEEECVALYRLSKVDVSDIAKPSKAHIAQLKVLRNQFIEYLRIRNNIFVR